VTLKRTHHWTMITVVNWASYQQVDDEAHHAEHHAEHHSELEGATREPPHRTPHAATPSKEVKNLDKKYTSNSELDSIPANGQPKPRDLNSRKPIAIDPAVQEWFESEFWPIYPRHEGKRKALEAANTKATSPAQRAFYLKNLRAQLPEYHRRKQESGQRVIPMGSTWFNQDRAEDELELSPESHGRGTRAAPQDNYPEYIPLSGRAM
jgi:hypothetical protein